MSQKKWIAGAVKRKGSYTRSVERRYGQKGFTKEGQIREDIKHRDAKKKGRIGKQARLAITLEKMKKKS